MTYTGSIPDTRRPTDWRTNAACRTEEPEMFFASDQTAAGQYSVEEAKAVCRRCPSQSACLQFAFDEGIDHGVFGGLTDTERRNMRRRQSRGTRARLTSPEESTTPAASLKEAFQRRTVTIDGGHLAWTGTRQVCFRGDSWTPKRAAFITDRGHDPQGLVLPVCGVDECVLPAHLTDAREREEQGLPDPRRAKCGSRAGYQGHLKRGEPVDTACRQANADADNRLRRTGTTKVPA